MATRIPLVTASPEDKNAFLFQINTSLITLDALTQLNLVNNVPPSTGQAAKQGELRVHTDGDYVNLFINAINTSKRLTWKRVWLRDVVEPSTVSDNDLWAYDSTSGQWIPQSAASAGVASSSRAINTTSPLSGGGDLSADRTLVVGGLASLGTANYVVGANSGATAWEYKQILGVANETDVTHAANSITIGLVNPLVVTKGGTGLSTVAINSLLYASALDTLAAITPAASSVLVSNGSNVPSWATDIPTAVTIGAAYIYRAGGTDLPPTDGGSGASTLTGILLGNGTSAFTGITTSAGIAGAISDETGSGALVFGTSPGFTTAANPVSNDGATLGTTALGWSDLYIASGGVIDWANGGVTLTHAVDYLTLGGGHFFVSQTGDAVLGVTGTTAAILRMTDSGGGTDAKNGQWVYDGSQPALVFQFLNDALGATTYPLKVFPASITPGLNDTAALGTTALMWSDLYLASGALIDFNNGDIVLTHSSNSLTLSGGALYVNSATELLFGLTSNTAAVMRMTDSGAGTDAKNGDWVYDGGALLFRFLNDALAATNYTLKIFPTAVTPGLNDVASLGTTALMWSDLFLANLGVINFSNGNVTLTHSAGQLALSGILKFAGTNTTGAGTALLGTNSPAATVSAPYTWVQVTTADGSTGYIPVWK